MIAANRVAGYVCAGIVLSAGWLGNKEKAMEQYRKAAQAAGHNPPTAFARPYARKKLG